MKISCEVIRDLLPLYHDGMCAAQTRVLVEEHLAGCEECRRALAALESPLADMEKNGGAAKAELSGVARQWKRGRLAAFAKGAAAAAAVCALALGLFTLLVGWHASVPYDLSALRVYDQCMLPDGRIAYRLDYPGSRYMEYGFEGGENGARYKVPYHSLTGIGEGGQRDWQDGDWHIYDWEEENAGYMRTGAPLTTAYYWGKGGNAVLVWSADMDIPNATAEQAAEIAAQFGAYAGNLSPAMRAAGEAGAEVTAYPDTAQLAQYLPYYLDAAYPSWRGVE